MSHYTRTIDESYKLYYIDNCPGARAVRLALRYKKYEFDEIRVDMRNGEHRTEQFLKMNPMHTVPVLTVINEERGNFDLWESRIILKYLLNSSFEIDRSLFWDMGFLYPNVGKIIYPKMFRNEEPKESDIPLLLEKLEYLNNVLENNDFIVNNKFSIADISCITLVQNTQFRKDLIDLSQYNNIIRWMDNVKNMFSESDWNDVMDPFYKNI